MSSIFKFSSFELVLIAVLSGAQIESKHFPHVLFWKTLLLKLPEKDFFKITQEQVV